MQRLSMEFSNNASGQFLARQYVFVSQVCAPVAWHGPVQGGCMSVHSLSTDCICAIVWSYVHILCELHVVSSVYSKQTGILSFWKTWSSACDFGPHTLSPCHLGSSFSSADSHHVEPLANSDMKKVSTASRHVLSVEYVHSAVFKTGGYHPCNIFTQNSSHRIL